MQPHIARLIEGKTFDVKPVTLRGPAASLEPLGPQHLEDLARVNEDPELWTYMGFSRLLTRRDLEEWLPKAMYDPEASPDVAFAILDLSGRAVGTTSLYDISVHDRRLEIGRTWIGRPYQRTAVNTQCKYLLLRHAFEDLGAIRVQLQTDSRNVRSQQAIERIGGTREGVLKLHRVVWEGYVRDSVLYSFVITEWEQKKAHLESLLARDA